MQIDNFTIHQLLHFFSTKIIIIIITTTKNSVPVKTILSVRDQGVIHTGYQNYHEYIVMNIYRKYVNLVRIWNE